MERLSDYGTVPRLWPLAALTLLLTACGEDDETDKTLRISGSPVALLAVNERYLFTPTAVDPEGEPLTFSITGRPAWLAFSQTTGVLSGTPTAADIGFYRDITIEVSDGHNTARLAPFQVEVVASGSRAATISWQTPTENEDGSALMDLAGFQIRYGRQPGSYSHRIDVPNHGVATYVVGGLVPGTYYFAMTAYTRNNVDSELSPETVIAIR
jgi:hypothetical protein